MFAYQSISPHILWQNDLLAYQLISLRIFGKTVSYRTNRFLPIFFIKMVYSRTNQFLHIFFIRNGFFAYQSISSGIFVKFGFVAYFANKSIPPRTFRKIFSEYFALLIFHLSSVKPISQHIFCIGSVFNFYSLFDYIAFYDCFELK